MDWKLPDYKVVKDWAVPVKPIKQLSTSDFQKFIGCKIKGCVGRVFLPISIRYNGGTVVNGKWCKGFDIPKPKLPKGYRLYSSWGAYLNCHPPVMEYHVYKIDKPTKTK